METAELHRWLLAGDPAVRWRVLRDVSDGAPRTVARERKRIATEGWGSQLLAAQSPDGGWGDGIYSPKWTSTTYTLLRLAWLGLPSPHPATRPAMDLMWQWASRWRSPETCVASILARLTTSHGYRTDEQDEMVRYVVGQQLHDGGWNCATKTDKDKHSSFHTTILALEALAEYDGPVPVAGAVARGREFFLRHRLYQSHRTGEVAIRASVRFPAFPEWHFDVLRGLEHFHRADVRDDRLIDAVEVVRRARLRDGRWPAYRPYPGKQWFPIDAEELSRFNTARVLAVLRWWDA